MIYPEFGNTGSSVVLTNMLTAFAVKLAASVTTARDVGSGALHQDCIPIFAEDRPATLTTILLACSWTLYSPEIIFVESENVAWTAECWSIEDS